LARLKAELELAHVDGVAAPTERLLDDVREALSLLGTVEDATHLRGAVLVVDDDARLAEITARGLRRLGFDADSSDALRALRPREVLVVDLSLVAILDATSYGEVVRSRPIVVTGATDSASRALAESLDASEYLVKPVELEDLAAAINRRMAEGGR
jgi:DNA-binding response OmpR family regulator